LAQVHNFSYGLLNPVLAYLVSCLGCFLGLQCTARARAAHGGARARWLLLAAVSIGTTGIWVMHFIAMLGYTIAGQMITYNVPVTILSMLIAVAVVAVGLFIVGFGSDGDRRRLLLGGSIIGIGVAGMHYMGMWAMRMPDSMSYNPVLLILSVIIAMVAGTAALWCARRLSGLGATLGASLIMGVAVSGMHYTGMAALHVHPVVDGGMLAMGPGASATAFLLPLILGISIVAFLVTAIVTMAPTAEEMREDAALMERIATLSENLGQSSRKLRLPAGLVLAALLPAAALLGAGVTAARAAPFCRKAMTVDHSYTVVGNGTFV
jgi:NO-binding membrane sensor protein with MHYT domain